MVSIGTRVALALAFAFCAFAPAKQTTCGELLAALNSVDAAVATTGAPDLRTRATAAIAASRTNPEGLVDFLGRDLRLQPLLDLKAAATGTETIGQHTLEALRNFNELRHYLDVDGLDLGDVSSGPGDLLSATLALHDIGKGLAIKNNEGHRQHEYTLPILERSLAAAGFSAKEIAVAKALVDNDTLGKLARNQLTPAQAQAEIEANAKAAGLDAATFYRLQSALWMADARSHKNLRDTVFQEMGDGTIRPVAHQVTALGAALNVPSVWKDAKTLAFDNAVEALKKLNATPKGTELPYADVFDFLNMEMGLTNRDKRFADFHREQLKLMARLAQPENAKTREQLANFELDFTANTFDSTLMQYNPAVARTQPNPPGFSATQGKLTTREIEAKPEDFVVFYHGTTATGAKDILRGGPDVERGDGEFGRGFYVTSDVGQAKSWATVIAGSNEKPMVLRVVIRKSELMKMHDEGTMLDFNFNDARTEGTPMQKAFDLFVAGNRMLRKQYPERTQWSRSLFEDVDVISGPSISNRGQVFDQFKFGGTERAKKLLSGSSPDMRIDAVDVP